YIYFSFPVILAALQLTSAGNVAVRIVRETAPYNIFGSNFQLNPRDQVLVAKSKPEKFAGPSHLKRLLGKCFNFSTSDYRYTLCPFQNITQVEDSYRWNAYKGVLGVWQGWTITNGTFASMIYAEGDSCGASKRSVQVTLTCGNHSSLLNVSEPERCKYAAAFATPLVCSDDALLVYPRLNATLRQRWNDVESQRFNDELTQKASRPRGYEKELNNIFQEAGFLKLPKEESTVAKPQAASDGTNDTGKAPTRLTNIAVCNAAMTHPLCFQEYEQLRAEVASLRMSLEMYQRSSTSLSTPPPS
ncbi:unnamed protein product, partial [Ixodes pacificus]